jgi:hypothetical protein
MFGAGLEFVRATLRAVTRSGRQGCGILTYGLAALVVGCAAPGTNLVECPLSGEKQQQAVLEIVPRGTSRSEAERKLRAAGIEYSPGQGSSIYYLGLWNRPDGKRWHINVALLFDKDGKVYQTRPADSSTEQLSNEALAEVRRQADATRAANSAGDPGGLPGDELQVPFPEQDDSSKSRR